jgi:hypothetical protein
VPIDFEHHAQTTFKNMPFTLPLFENKLINYNGHNLSQAKLRGQT